MPVLVAIVVLVAAEVAVLIEVGRAIGTGLAILLLLAISAAGPALVRRAGFGVWRRTRERLDAGQVPGREALDGVILLAGGVLVCVPGFITDVIGLALLAPPTRSLARRVAGGWLARRAGRLTGTIVTTTVGDPRERNAPGPGDAFVDVDSHPADERRPPLPPGDPPAGPGGTAGGR